MLFINMQTNEHELRHLFWISTYSDEQRLVEYDLIDRAKQFHIWWNDQRATKFSKLRYLHSIRLNGANARYHRSSLRNLKKIKSLCKQIAVVREDSSEVCLLLNDLRFHDQAFAQAIRSTLNHDDILVCDDCGEFYDESDNHITVDDRNICESCCDDNYRYSSCMDGYIRSANAFDVYDSSYSYRNENPDDVCTSRYGNSNFEQYDNVYFSDIDAYYEVSDSDNDDEDREDEEADDYLPSWHNATRNFVTKNKTGKYPALGAELEIYVPYRNDFVIETRSEFDVILEKDGSIDDYCGVEIITNPLGREEWAVLAPALFEHIHNHKGVGYNEPAGDSYGIHLTISREHLSPLAEARIAMFLCDSANASFVRAVSQRNQIYSSNHGVGFNETLHPVVSTISSEMSYRMRNGVRQKKIYGRGKYCPVNFKENLAEFRIFQSTTNETSFQKNLEFVWALWAWTKPETASGCSHSYVDFLTWLNKRQQRKEFPELVRFLSKRVFYGTNYNPIISSWQGLMTKPNELEACEPMAA
jgi:hypothetical protein